MTPDDLTTLIDATWPAQSVRHVQGWTIRTGAGAGNRVSAATATKAANPEKHAIAENAMRDLGQTPLFMVRSGEDPLDAVLAAEGYSIKDPTLCYTAPVANIAIHRPPAVTCFQVWPPLAMQVEIWNAGGIDDARLAVMERASAPKTTVLGRVQDTPAGTGFAAIQGTTAMLHAIETLPAFRRQGLGRYMIGALAFWAQERGAKDLAILVTTANKDATALYSSMGFIPVGGYHYRIHPKAKS